MVFNTVLVDLHNFLLVVPSLDEKNGKLLSSICKTFAWSEYEKGLMDQTEAYNAVSVETDGAISPETIEQVISLGHSLLTVQTTVFDVLKKLKTLNGCRLFAISNISKPDYECLQSRFGDILNELFEKVFPSHAYYDRKPYLSFYRRVLAELDTPPTQIVFIDDEIDNVIGAASLGMRGVHANKKNIEKSVQLLYNLCRIDPCAAGTEYLQRHAGQHASHRSDGKDIQENFSQMFLLEATNDISLTKFVPHTRLFHFFQDALTVSNFPYDLDTTSIGLTTTNHVPLPVIHSVLDEILAKYINQDGIVQVYFDARRPRTDPNASVNVLSLFYTYGRGHQLSRTEDWVFDVLATRTYDHGTRYYPLPECFLFLLARLFKRAPDVKRRMLSVFVERVEERLGQCEEDPLAISMRLFAAHAADLTKKTTNRIAMDLEKLRMLQQIDGSWNSTKFTSYGSTDICIGNRGLTTALAINAIRAFDEEKSS